MSPKRIQSRWTPTLRMMVEIMLADRFPILLWWGPEFRQFYNNPYGPVLGTKHPQYPGEPVGRELRMIELKQEINAICAQLGHPTRDTHNDEEAQP